MHINEYLARLDSGEYIEAGSPTHMYMHGVSQEALRLTAELNGKYHTPEEIRAILEQITGRPVDKSVGLFPPFHTDCGKNIHLGKGVFINMGCKFQDQGGIYIDDGALIGHNVVLATINHDMNPLKRHGMTPAPIHIGKNVWVGSNSVILPGVTIGDGAVIAAGAVVGMDIPENMVAGGVPAKILKKLNEDI